MKNLKRILSYVMMVIMCVFLFSGVSLKKVLANERHNFNTNKGTLSYEISDNNEITIVEYSGRDTELEIPGEIYGKSVTRIRYKAFFDCNNLISITIPNSVTSIGDSAFWNCKNLTSVTIPNSLTSIGYGVFLGCENLTSITIPNSVTSIGDSAFHGCRSLTSITIPNSVTSIGKEAFYGCKSLTSIIIPDSVVSIGREAFSACKSLTSIIIPSSVESMEQLFLYCSNLTNISVDKDNKCFTSENGILFNKDKSKLLCYPSGKKEKSYIIPNSVTEIGNSAFYSCENLTSMVIPNLVTSIGDVAFWGCESLTNITIPNSVTEIGDSTFYGCSNLTNITIPNSVTSIGDVAFWGCESLTNITIPNSVTEIGEFAFLGCKSLTNITIPNSVTEIQGFAFKDCDNLTSITIPNSVTIIGFDVFINCNNNVIIYGYKNSYAETYAHENSIQFKELNIQNLNIESFTTDKTSPQISGTKVTLTAKASGSETLQYKFLVRNDKGNWYIIKNYSTSNTAVWTTGAIGNKTLYVDVKDENGKVVRKEMPYTVKAVAPTISSFTANKVSPQVSGTKVTLTAKASGSGTLQYKFLVRDDKGNWYIIKNYSTSNIAVWTTGAIGNKTLYVDVKNGNEKVVRKEMPYTVKAVTSTIK